MYNYLYVDDDIQVSMTTSNDQLADKNMVTSEDLEVEFAITTNKIKQALNNSPSPIDVKSVVEQLQTISAVKDKNIPLLDGDVLKDIITVEKLWEKLNRFWSIFDYDSLKILLRIVECKRANEIFEEFLSKIDVSTMEDMDLVHYYEVFEREGSVKPLLRIKINAKKCTCYTERKIKKILSSKFNIEEYSLWFRGIKEGCNELVFEISNGMMSYFLECKFAGYHLADFATHNIISLHLNDMELQIPPEINMVCS